MNETTDRRSRLSPAKQALLEKRLRGERARPAGESPIGRRPAEEPAPLSSGQERLWFLDQLEQGGSAYNLPGCWRLQGSLDVKALERSLGEVLRRHEALRTTIATEDGRPFQVIAPRESAILFCRCGSPGCRGRHKVDFFSLPVGTQLRYLPYLDAAFVRIHGSRLRSLVESVVPARVPP